ncbi:MAG: thymidine kinase [Actinomycetales bacterium]|nr:thymidine kinase [Actinomycetales bacterium]
MSELVFYAGTMDCGKSTLALQTDHNHRSRGRSGIVLTRLDRSGASVLSSRLGLAVAAVEVDERLDIWQYVVGSLSRGERVDYLICDEAQFYAPEQVEQLCRVVDELRVDVYAFGIMTDFRTRLFPGSARLVELADRVQVLQVEALCWCGARAIHNARTVDGVMVVEGDQVMVGDVAGSAHAGTVAYEVLCRRHYRARRTASVAQAEHMSAEPLPFGTEGPAT